MSGEENLVAWIWVSLLGKNNNKIRNKLIKYFGNIEKAWEVCDKHKNFADIKIEEKLLEKIRNKGICEKAKKIHEEIQKNRYKVITLDSEKYPQNLKNIYSPPCVLYYLGQLPVDLNINTDNLISIVGSRRCTAYGKTTAFRFAKKLAENNVGIVSGLARGIDSEAHKGALWSDGYTIAVLGSGIDVVYPKENIKLFNDIAEKGCILTEFPPETPPLRNNFPARNRIVSGLSRGVLVVEAAKKSGAMITVDMALEQGKNIYVIPGNIYSEASEGCNELIKKGAYCVTKYEDILEDLSIDVITKSSGSFDDVMLSQNEKLILKQILNGYFTPDEISDASLLDISEVLTSLTMLQFKGILLKDFDGSYKPII